ncbi:DUF6603 domain-containing protein [Rufibacter glacialis]|uniref:DUF6603 domain-containing protein n=1 Tax=Rufibacter glacialis TaxID=1259555 RepID=A0A5M8QJ49_9BACT|nr:DUF6603 domain-containing protein [Rufibacter glacialis]KAA6434786.1 hypothetical protein FOE74_11485 [Rufibacter glacialis]GGK72412.1 hypothetical protein GCM10011405_20820 [Rufibacter glacialis]
MAEKTQEKDLFQSILKTVRDILSPGIKLLGDPASRTEFLNSLGLKETSQGPDATSTESLDKYINKEKKEVDAILLADAMANLTQLMLSLEGFFRAAAVSEEDKNFAASEALDTFTNILVIDYIRRRRPTFHSVIQLISVVGRQTAAEGGSIKFVKDILIGYFKRLGQGFDKFATEEDAKTVSDCIFLLLGSGFFLLDKLVLEKYGIETVQIESWYGFEGVKTTRTPVADSITDRTLSYSITITPADKAETTFYNTLSWVPNDHGGVSLLVNQAGILNYLLSVGDGKSVKFDAAGEGIFRIGNQPDKGLGLNNHLGVEYKHERKTPSMWSMFNRPAIKIGFGTYGLGLKITPDDFVLYFKSEMPFFFGRGGLTGFPFDKLPEKVEEKIPLSFGYSLQRNFFFGDSSAGTPAKTSTTTSALSRDGDGGGTGAGAGASGGEGGLVAGLAKMILNAIDLRLPLHKNIGNVVGLEVLNVKTGVQGNFENIVLETSLDFWLKFGPVLTLAVSRLGMNLNLNKRTVTGGIGGYDLVPSLKMPNGVGVKINAEVIKGGGFLYIDEPRGEYFGSLELEFKNSFTLKAVGLINTIMPDGSKGFSMIVIITAEFAPMQLPFGFTLLGVGGLLGLNRTVQVETLRLGLKTNAIKSVLFPEDVIGNLPRIISDLKQIFPIREGQFLIGLMAKIGWGTPTLIKIELGLMVEIPDPKILILGVISTKLPTEEAALLKLQVNFLGVMDFQNKFIYFEAQLFDSMLVGFPLTGSLAFAVAWGNQSVFAISVGGFHPDFRDYPSVPTLPSAFRDMVRIGLSLLSGNNPRLTIECYFAITSNSLQFGAKLELLAAGPMGFNLYGLLAFDAIFIFDPFGFTISLEATLAIRKNTSILFGIHFKGVLSGTTPWHIVGEVTFGLLFFDVTIGFDATWGDSPVKIDQATEDLLGKVKSELKDIRNWRAELPETQHQAVSHRSFEEEENPPLVLYPYGELRFSQRTIPLNYKMEQYGSLLPRKENLITISKVLIDTEVQATDPEKEMFAPGHFTKLSESEKLSRKSFEMLDSGFKLKDSGKLLTAKPHLKPVVMNYELNYTQDDDQVFFPVHDLAFRHLVRQSAVSKSNLSWGKTSTRPLNSPAKVEVNPVGFAIANTSNLTDFAGGFRASTLVEAKEHIASLVKGNPALADKIQVVESFELAL